MNKDLNINADINITTIYSDSDNGTCFVIPNGSLISWADSSGPIPVNSIYIRYAATENDLWSKVNYVDMKLEKNKIYTIPQQFLGKACFAETRFTKEDLDIKKSGTGTLINIGKISLSQVSIPTDDNITNFTLDINKIDYEITSEKTDNGYLLTVNNPEIDFAEKYSITVFGTDDNDNFVMGKQVIDINKVERIIPFNVEPLEIIE